MTNLKSGDKVMIYEDPMTRTKEEGIAELIELERQLADGYQRWIVNFDGDHGLDVYRTLRNDLLDPQ